MSSTATRRLGARSARTRLSLSKNCRPKVHSMKRFCSLRSVIVMLFAAAVLTVPSVASAAERAHRSRGTAEFLPGSTDFVGSGSATHLSRYQEIGSVTFWETTDPTAVPITAWSIYTAANGDELWATFEGHLNSLTGKITATVTYWGGTGRYEDANGSGKLTGQIQANGTIAVNVQGRIDY